MSERTLQISPEGWTLDELKALREDASIRVTLSETSRAAVEASRGIVESHLGDGNAYYGINTGFGKLSSQRIPAEKIELLQRNLILSHACGVGDPLPVTTARRMLLLRALSLARGYSGARTAVVDQLLALYNRGITPVIPEQGSVGASGDLAPLAHLAMVLIGEGEAIVDGKRMSGAEALEQAGLEPLVLQAKEGLALINGTQMMTSLGTGVALDLQHLSRVADIAGALSLEALMGSIKPFDGRIHQLKPHPGQVTVAENVRRLLEGSEILPSHADCNRVQDPYCLRCMPQVHGASRGALDHVCQVLTTEINSVSDNPLIFEDGDILSGGNFHGQAISMAMDYAGIAAAEWASISERRIENLVNPDLSGLPAFLVEGGGVNSGFMIPQVVAAALVSENKGLAHPASVDSIPTSGNKEDHVSMGVTAARTARAITRNLERVLAIELMCGAQGLDYRRPLKAGRGVEAAFSQIRERVTKLECDRYLAPDIDALVELVKDRRFVERVEESAGKLS
ncbi:MAG: histidine ammonia-lyase [Planctomycetota bacterium]